MTGQSSADPDDLDRWVQASREQNTSLSSGLNDLGKSHTQFRKASQDKGGPVWGDFDATQLTESLDVYVRYNENDTNMTQKISAAFRQADADARGREDYSWTGAASLGDEKIAAVLRSAGFSKAGGPSADHPGAPGFRSTAADRKAFRERYELYERDAQHVREVVARNSQFRNIPEEDLVAVTSYTFGGWRGEVNEAFRNNRPEVISKYDPFIRATVSGLNALPAYEGRVFRILNVSAEELAQIRARYQKDVVLTEEAFVSTTTWEGMWEGNVKMTIQSRTGRDIDNLSWSREREILIAPGRRFKVLDAYTDDKGVFQIKMIELE